MAPSKPMFFSAFLLLLLLLAFFLSHNNLSSDYYYCRWTSVIGCRGVSGESSGFRVVRGRKMLIEMKKKMGEEVDGGKRRRWQAAEWEQLRRVPSGPDPLHHNGGNPKKPRTP